ncbi:hypothetical protein [Streptomyces sp. NPDC006012]|uniref:hypothetical protein n=1 Tax=Streptomyces sp. NPDC006012 TaxID=3364739 RepID=UPI0036742C59
MAGLQGLSWGVGGSQGWIMASYFELLDREEAAVRDCLSGLREELERVHQQIGEAENRLQRLAITRETLESLPTEKQMQGGPIGSGAQTPAADEAAVPSGTASERWQEPVGPLEWEEGRRRMLSLLATAGRAMKVREIAAAVGEDISTPARVETTRGRLKRLAEEGHVVEGPVGWFAIAAGSAATGGEGTVGEG